ncbi:MAG: L-threonylcarbamoyladenylate synthase [Bdellovibrionota bacterium]
MSTPSVARARVLAPSPENLALAAEALARGDVVGMPTETVYGLAGAAFNPMALARIFETKERPTFDPLIIHVGPLGRGLEQLARLHLIDLPSLSPRAQERARKLIDQFWPGPLTLVLPKHADVPDLATSGLATVALRMPRHPVAQALIAQAGMPLAAPSANRFGRISPTTPAAVLEELGDRIDLILDGGPCEIGLESTVLAIEPTGTLRLLRPGGISRQEIEVLLGQSVELPPPVLPSTAASSPGMLASHYAPSKPLRILPSEVLKLRPEQRAEILALLPASVPADAKLGLLIFSGKSSDAEKHFSAITGRKVTVLILSEKGDLSEAAHHLFTRLRTLDGSSAEALFCEPVTSERGLGHAIADRLRRAST